MRQAQQEHNTSRAVVVVMAVVCAVLTAGCSVKNTRPVAPAATVQVPQQWQPSTVATPTAAAPDLSHWWQQLNDTTLSNLMTQALAANHDLRGAQSRLREARARRVLAGKDYRPSVTASASASETGTRADSTNSSRGAFDVGLDASWEPDIFGATRQAVLASQYDLETAVASLQDTQVSLVAEVALSYVQLRSYQGRLAIATDNLARQTETLSLTTWKAQAGLATELDVEQARTNVEQTRAGIPSLETGVLESEHALALLTGQVPTALHDLLSVVGPIPTVPEQVLLSIPADTLRQRPDVRSAESSLKAATARLGAAHADLYPSLRLSGSFGIQGGTLGKLLSLNTIVGSLASSLTASVFDRGKLRTQIEIQSAAQEQSLITYEKTMLTALEDVENALVTVANVRRRGTALTDAAASARKAAELARFRYSAGLTTYQTVLDTERSMLSAEDTLKTNEAEAVSALIRLYKALGGGWDQAPARS